MATRYTRSWFVARPDLVRAAHCAARLTGTPLTDKLRDQFIANWQQPEKGQFAGLTPQGMAERVGWMILAKELVAAPTVCDPKPGD
jgi:hypothetical protein